MSAAHTHAAADQTHEAVLIQMMEIETEHQTNSIDLAIRGIGGVVLMLVVRFDLKAFVDWEWTTYGLGRSAEFSVPAVVVDLPANIGGEVIGLDLEFPFRR